MTPDDLRGVAVAVTGAAGFVGRRLVARLQALGARVSAIGRDAPPLHDVPALRAALRDVRCVFHLAALTSPTRDPADLPGLLHVNAEGTACVLAACPEGLRGFITLGSAEEFGPEAAVPIADDAPARPQSPYGISKLAATEVTLAAARARGVPATVLRAFLLYGPGQSLRFLIPQLVEAVRTGVPVDMTPGEQTRDLLHVDDAVEALIAAIGTPALAGTTANLCSGRETSLQEIVSIFEKRSPMPTLARLGALPYRSNEIFRYVGSCERLRGATGWQPKIALEEGIATLL